jgi:D-alanine transaminase
MTVYLNGDFLPIEDAKISVLDRGFIFGDGVYEVIPVYSRRAFRLPDHLARLQHSLDSIQLKNPLSESEWGNIIQQLITRNAPEDQYLYLHITRGVAKRDHPFPNPAVAPTVFLMSNPLNTSTPALLQTGIARSLHRIIVGYVVTLKRFRCYPMSCFGRWLSMPVAWKPS